MVNTTNLISIVIPVFNTDTVLLEDCIESALSQEGCNFEIVLVDDGSSKIIADFCDLWMADSRVKLVHQENMGLSGARNTGVAVCKGDYVFFLDSDDSFENSGSLRKFARAVATDQTVDVVVGQYHFECKNEFWHVAKTGKDWLIASLRNGKVSFAATDTLYSKSLLFSMENLFRLGLVHEDEDFSPRVLLAASRVVGITDQTTYHRNISNDSITKSNASKAAFNRCRGKLLIAQNSLSDSRFSVDPLMRCLMDVRAFGFVNMAIREWSKSNFDEAEELLLKNICEGIDYSACPLVLRNGRDLRTFLCMKMLGMVGLDNYKKLVNAFM